MIILAALLVMTILAAVLGVRRRGASVRAQLGAGVAALAVAAAVVTGASVVYVEFFFGGFGPN